MKKVLFTLLAAGFTFASCNSESTSSETEVAADTATVVETKKAEVETEVDTVEVETEVDTLQQQ